MYFEYPITIILLNVNCSADFLPAKWSSSKGIYGNRPRLLYSVKGSKGRSGRPHSGAAAGSDPEAADPAAGAAGDSNPNGSKAKMRK